MSMRWQGVFPAVTTPFRPDGSLDVPRFESHLAWLIEAGCSGIVPLGSLGEAATLSAAEKKTVLEAAVRASAGRVPVVAGISALGTEEAAALAETAAACGCAGLMVLPPYVYRGDWRETRAHLDAVIEATCLPCMLYNNPIAYGTDLVPDHVAELARHGNLAAVKESSGDVRRMTELHARLGDRVALFVGIDDLLLEGVQAGAVGWIAGLVNALPHESVRLFELTAAGRWDEARALYTWFLPLLRLDTSPKFVQLIKLLAAETSGYPEAVRPPRLILEGPEREDALERVRVAFASRVR